MKKSLSILALLLTTFLITGCTDEIKKEAGLLKADSIKAYDNLKTEIDELVRELTETKDKIEETTSDIKEAKDAVEEVFE